MKGFDPLVPFYDSLARFVFLGAIQKSQKCLVSYVKPNSSLLILGGGTGELLESLDSSVQVTYVELSVKMIERAKKRKTKAKVKFEQLDFLNWTSPVKYDYVICPFFLDLFSEKRLVNVLDKIRSHLNSNGKLFVADFDGASTSFFHRVLLKLMFLFFSITGAIMIKKYNGMFEVLASRFEVVEATHFFYRGFIRSSIYSNDSS